MYHYTNKSGLHPLLAAILTYNEYDSTDDPYIISTTSIMKPTQMIALERANWNADKIIDVEGLIPSVMGSAMHALLEKGLETVTDDVWRDLGVEPKDLEILQENRVVKQVPGTLYKLSGKYDVLYRYKGSAWRLADLKTQSVWGVMLSGKEKEQEYIKQLSIYRWLNQDKEIDDIAEIFYWFTDWSKQKARSDSQYPQSRLGHKEIMLWSIEETETYIKNRVIEIDRAIKNYKETGDTKFRCNREELWQTDDVYKYYKPNKSGKINYSRAYKVCNSLQEAQDLIMKFSEGDIKFFPGEIKRCNYCSVTEFCPQYKEYKEQGLL